MSSHGYPAIDCAHELPTKLERYAEAYPSKREAIQADADLCRDIIVDEITRLCAALTEAETRENERWRRLGMAPDAPDDQKIAYLSDRFDGHQRVIQRQQGELFDALGIRDKLIRRSWRLRCERDALAAAVSGSKPA